ncbi:dienelactone hydrolase family protein [Aspergillus clavatus NRRL 1]|uniref:Dienelactone hydrolase family protein n=1 Tax=Aspergillus clavatus (strain ATCC 1007 / CBS 513.65 / DSM 816 / NCTC 3887 / NRRL 1 / QM 1276 / 107) TaxID=344612 RepID=A1CUB5_ASPCL|nr:dienelactone hydrolase family protein [Aspergillus clavatus NRRL 1]EAW06902.1 dienelactone hydrolase family protein [Aspergillus clavatus NRRL 1]
MASNPPGACCASGFKHEGNPVGEIKKIEGVEAYFSYPKDNKSPEKAVLILSDIFGIYVNAQLLADELAANGYLAVIPDLFRGDAIKVSDMESGKVNITAWITKHQIADVEPVIESSIKHLRQELGVKRIAGAGYCFGGKYVCRFLKPGKIDVGYTAHPSFVTKEELAAIAGPLSIAASEIDQIFNTQLRHDSEGILIKTGQPWQINLFSGVSHGFAVRADLNNKHFKWAKEQAFGQAVAWFNQYL